MKVYYFYDFKQVIDKIKGYEAGTVCSKQKRNAAKKKLGKK